MSVGKQISSAWSLLLSGLVFLLVAFPAAAQDVTRAPGDTARSAMTPVPGSAKSTLTKDAVRPVKASQPGATQKNMSAKPKPAAASGRDDPAFDRLPASDSGLGCAEVKDQ